MGNFGFKVHSVEIGNFQFSPGRGFQIRRNVQHPVIVEIEARHGPVGFRIFGFFLKSVGLAFAIERDDVIAFRIFNSFDRFRPGSGRAICLIILD